MDNTFAKNLKKFRLAKNYTQEQVADRMNVNMQTVSRWECGTTLPDVMTLPILARLYGVTVDDFYKENSIAYDNYAQRLAAVYEKSRAPEDFFLCLTEYKKLSEHSELSIADKWNMAMIHQFMLAYCKDVAMQWYDKILAGSPDADPHSYHRAYSCRTALFFALGEGDKVIEELRRKAEVNPQSPRDADHLLEAMILGERFEESYDRFKAAAEKFPNDWEILIHGGEICSHLEKYDEALACFDKAGEIGTFFCDELYCKAHLYEKLGKLDEARSEYLGIADTLRKRGFDIEAEMAERDAAAVGTQA